MSRPNYFIVALLLFGCTVQVFSICCPPSEQSAFCEAYEQLTPEAQHEIKELLGENCDGNAEEALKNMEKRKPNFIRFGRSDPNFLRFGRSAPQNNFLRFGKSAHTQQNFLRFGKRAMGSEPNFLRFGRATEFMRLAKSADPNFLRFGRSPDAVVDPNFLRFGKSNNFLRFGRSSGDEDSFEREYRKPNFLLRKKRHPSPGPPPFLLKLNSTRKNSIHFLFCKRLLIIF
uniref:FMRFamide n=1 Tax=Panagrolaimus sp. JU765 TaxID=591449 RepID=A0AC34QCW6_9BILA